MLLNCGAGEESLGQQGDQITLDPKGNPKGNQHYSVERPDAEAPILWPHDAKS